MKATSLQVPIENTREYRRPGGSRGRWVAWIAAAAGVATIVLALPLLFGFVGRLYRIADAPEQIVALAKHQKEIDERQTALEASQREIREGLNRILSAMHLDPIQEPKKENQP